MAGVNRVILIGNLGKDPEIRHTESGLAIVKFSLATTEGVRAERSKGEDRTEWHNIVAFDKLAEICGKYLHKGKQVYIEGRIQTRDWTDKEGNKRWTTEIIAHVMKMLGPKEDGQGQREPSKPPVDDDDIPF